MSANEKDRAAVIKLGWNPVPSLLAYIQSVREEAERERDEQVAYLTEENICIAANCKTQMQRAKEAEAQAAALRANMKVIRDANYMVPAGCFNEIDKLIHDTAAAAAEHDARIWRSAAAEQRRQDWRSLD